MREIINGERFVLGTCYYPEHWEQSLWEDDLDRMLRSGIEVIRIAEFAWNLIEPREGEYTYEFFDRFLELAHAKGMKVIFGTPTATPPAWLTEKYPEVLNADQNGVLYRHGARRHYNYNSPVYQKFCRIIVEKSASHYGGSPAVIGWQIDNEVNCELDEFYSESDTIAFRRFLMEKYGTIEKLNQAWGTVFWNQTYNDWEEIHVPRRTPHYTNNPHHMLDYYRFVSDSARKFVRMQAEIIRKYCKKDDFITTNGLFGNLDNHQMTRESLDFMTYDSYPNFAYCLDDYQENDLMKDRKWSRNLAETRSTSTAFGIMEQQSGANGWTTRMEAPTPRPGQITLWTMQSIAHGADFISYFRWRTCTFGTEMYWHGILDYSGRDNRRLLEIQEISKKLAAMQEIAGARYAAKVGVLKDYDNVWDAQQDKWHQRVEKCSQKSLFTALQITHTPFDYVYFEDAASASGQTDSCAADGTGAAKDSELEKLCRYDLLFYPHASILIDERVELLEKYVSAGGKLVMGCRTGYKDIFGKCVMEHLPGKAAALTGTDIPEYSFVAPDDGKVMADWDGTLIEAAVFNDLLAPTGENAEVLARYTSSYYAGTPALIRSRCKKGEAYYFGGAFALDTVRAFLEKLGVSEPYGRRIYLPECCELAVREKDGWQYLFVLNYAAQAVKIELREEMQEIFSGKSVCGESEMSPYEVKIFKCRVQE